MKIFVAGLTFWHYAVSVYNGHMNNLDNNLSLPLSLVEKVGRQQMIPLQAERSENGLSDSCQTRYGGFFSCRQTILTLVSNFRQHLANISDIGNVCQILKQCSCQSVSAYSSVLTKLLKCTKAQKLAQNESQQRRQYCRPDISGRARFSAYLQCCKSCG